MKKIVCVLCILLVAILSTIYKDEILTLKNQKKVLASIVITAYNRTELLIQAIESARNQTYKNIEIIIVNDGSNNQTFEVLQNYEKQDSRINVVSLPKNSGKASFPRAVGNSVAKGKYITILDSDDVLMPTMIEKVVKFMEENEQVDLLRTETRHYNTNTDPYTQNWPYILPLYHLVYRSIGQGGFTFKREFIEQYNIFPNPDMQCGEDWDFVSKMLIHKASFAHLSNEPLYIIRYHGDNYYMDCVENSTRIQKNIKKALSIESENPTPCELLKKSIEFNPQIFDEETKNAGLKDLCHYND